MSAPPLAVPSLAEMIESCKANQGIAERQIERVRARLEKVTDECTERDMLIAQLGRYESDYRHWSDYVGYYRARAGREGAAAVPTGLRRYVVQMLRKPNGALVPPVPDRRLPREVGEDDEEEGVPF